MTTERHFTLFLMDILDACDACSEFVEGITLQGFHADLKTKLAVERGIEIVGEAASNVPQHVRQVAPNIPWRRVAGMRNRLAHEYFAVHHGIVWNTVHQFLPPLRTSVERLLATFSEQP